MGGYEMIHNTGLGAGNNGGWQDNIVPGGPHMLFVEDNTFTNNDSVFILSAHEGFYGARTVWRHNTHVGGIQVEVHGNGAVGARWLEVYQNTFNCNGASTACGDTVEMRAGSGVTWGNSLVGDWSHANGGGSIVLWEEGSASWPNAWQVGSAINGYTAGHSTCPGPLNTAPVYVWGNAGSVSTPASQMQPPFVQAGTIALNRDYFVSSSQPASMQWMEASGDTCSTTYSYVPYTYPHPLQGTTSSGPAPPSGLAASVQ
jgi:hypothetical protein